MKIVKLTVSNIMRLSAVEMEPNGSVIVIGGRNAQGKSSVLAAIEMALGGGKHAVDQPVRAGAESGSIIADLGEIQVERHFSADGGSSLKVRSANGAVFPSPQAMLDALVGKLTFDPLAFSRAKPTDQANTLRQLAKIDTTDLDTEKQILFASRTDVNREVERLAGAMSQIPDPPAGVDVPDVEPDVVNLVGQLDALGKRNSERAKYAVAAAAAATRVENEKKAFEDADQEVARSFAAWEWAKMESGRRAALVNAAMDDAYSTRESAAKAQAEMEPDVDIKQRIADSQKISALVRAKIKKAETTAAWFAKAGEATVMTTRLNQIAEERRKRIADAAYPIAGLKLGDDAVMFNDIPLSQASGAEQLRVSVSIGLALNPKLKVMIVRDGSLLDEGGMKLLEELATAADGQVWLERVSTGKEVQFLIEDGHIAPMAAPIDTTHAADTARYSGPMPGFNVSGAENKE